MCRFRSHLYYTRGQNVNIWSWGLLPGGAGPAFNPMQSIILLYPVINTPIDFVFTYAIS